MPRSILIPLLAFGGLFVSLTVSGADAPRQSATKLDKQVRVSLDYLLYLPAEFEQKDSWPLLVFLHGAGERGDDLNRVKVHGPPKLIEQGKSFPFVVVSPQCGNDRWWPSQMLELTSLIDDVSTKFKIDPDRIYLTGLSMGGFGTWSLAAYSPDRFAAIVPICGGGEPIAARRLSHLPIWAFHGAKDFVVPLRRSEEMVDALKKLNADVKLTVYPEAGHDSWSAAYDSPELYEWLLKQTRKPPAKPQP